jgi:hypothetical protein
MFVALNTGGDPDTEKQKVPRGKGTIKKRPLPDKAGDPGPGQQTVTFANRGGDGRANGFQTTPFTPAAWNHLVCTYDGTDPYDVRSYSIYVNGRSLGLKPTVFLNGAPFGGDTKRNNLGYDSYSFGAGSTPKYFIGSLSELLVYNTVLSAGDVEVLYGGRQRKSDDSYPRRDNLVAGYHLDEGPGMTVADFSGHGNAGTLHGGVTWVSGTGAAAGPHANALHFDGTRYATLPQSTKFTAGDFTISLWFDPTTADRSQYLFMRGFAFRDQQGDIGLRIEPSSQSLLMMARTDDSRWLFDWTMPGPRLQGHVKVNQWNHVVVTRRGDTYTMWMNGQPASSQVAAGDISDADDANPFLVGGFMFEDGVHEKLQGDLDEFRVFHRCLSDAEIADLYRGSDVRGGDASRPPIERAEPIGDRGTF